MPEDPLIPKHGGYRGLKSFQVAQLAYDLTVRFCDHYIDRRSRTHDQMAQPARSGVQNIAEGSQASGTSRTMEMKLTNVARASLEELRLDYEDYLRQHGLPLWDRDDPLPAALIARRPRTEDDVAAWAREARGGAFGGGGPGRPSGSPSQSTAPTPSTGSTGSAGSTPSTPSTPPPSYPEVLANAAVALITVASFLLDRQLAGQSEAFVHKGGFTERLYGQRRRRSDGP